jgi:phospholipase/carboxylesterase
MGMVAMERIYFPCNELPDEYYVIAARAPYDLQYGSYAWYAINFDANQNKFLITKAIKSMRFNCGIY